MVRPVQEHAQIPPGSQVIIVDFESEGIIYHDKLGVIVDSPFSLPKDVFLVRCPDRSEVAVPRDKLRYRKGVQADYLYEPPSNEKLLECIIYKCIIGSQAYGLSTDKSDIDIRGVYLPTASMHWSLFGLKDHFEAGEDGDFWEFQKFLVMALKANPNVLECIYTPLKLYVDPLFQILLDNKEKFLSKIVYATYNGYAASQLERIGTSIRNGQPVRMKHSMHLLRLLMSGIYLLKEQDVLVEVPRSLKDKLLSVRNGLVSWEEVDAWRLQLHKEFEEAYEVTKIPPRPDFNWVNSYLIEVRKEMAKRETQ